jgi:hypothetical protein
MLKKILSLMKTINIHFHFDPSKVLALPFGVGDGMQCPLLTEFFSLSLLGLLSSRKGFSKGSEIWNTALSNQNMKIENFVHPPESETSAKFPLESMGAERRVYPAHTQEQGPPSTPTEIVK